MNTKREIPDARRAPHGFPRRRLLVLAIALTLLALSAGTVSAFHEGGLVELNSHMFTWVDPDSGGVVEAVEEVFEGCEGVDEAGTPFFNPHDMTFRYTINNVSYDPIPGITNGFSGYQMLFPGPVPELYNQQSPVVGGPWEQNAYSGNSPPFGAEWDAPLPGVGIMPGETGVFSFCTFERVDVVVQEPDAGWVHTWGIPVPEPIVDSDGTGSALAGDPSTVEVQVLDTLSTWPTGGWNQGLDMFDTNADGLWDGGDDLHVEDPATHPGAIRNGVHDDFLDPLVLDLDNSLDPTPGLEPVDCDLESGTFCPVGFPWGLAFFDANINGYWDDGEDIVLDLDGNGIFGYVENAQDEIFNVTNSVPGELYFALDLDACSADHEICKKIKYLDENGDGIIEVGEPISFLEVIQVHNPSPDEWASVVVKDRWGAEIDVTSATPSQGTATLTTKGKSEKEFLHWDVGLLPPGGTANLVLDTMNDINPGGHQQYTSEGLHDYNSGAVLKFQVQPEGAKKPHQMSFDTGSVTLMVEP